MVPACSRVTAFCVSQLRPGEREWHMPSFSWRFELLTDVDSKVTRGAEEGQVATPTSPPEDKAAKDSYVENSSTLDGRDAREAGSDAEHEEQVWNWTDRGDRASSSHDSASPFCFSQRSDVYHFGNSRFADNTVVNECGEENEGSEDDGSLDSTGSLGPMNYYGGGEGGEGPQEQDDDLSVFDEMTLGAQGFGGAYEHDLESID